MDFLAYKSFLKKEYPSAYDFLQSHSWKPSFFPETVSLSFKTYQQMEKVIQSLFLLKSKRNYFNSFSAKTPETALKNQSQSSVLMAYDFHVEKKIPYLIEVNTNASGFLLVNSLYQFQNLPYKEAKEDLKKSFQSEWEKFNKDNKNSAKQKPQKLILIDDDPLNQKMILEFFMYKDFFCSMNWPFEIHDSRSLKTDNSGNLYTSKGKSVDFIYNRSTDFYFEEHPHLAEAYLKGTCAVSPNPREYYLLSDKNRLCEWSSKKETWLELRPIRHNFPFADILTAQNQDEAWKNRKKYFFKVCRGHGGQLVYKGASLTRKKFDELRHSESLIQEFIPPLRITDSQGQEWKTDFRVYAYEDQIQQLTARCYQGQLTNFRQENSGFAIVNVIYDGKSLLSV